MPLTARSCPSLTLGYISAFSVLSPATDYQVPNDEIAHFLWPGLMIFRWNKIVDIFNYIVLTLSSN